MALGPGDPLYESWKMREAAQYAALKGEELFLKGSGPRATQALSKVLKNPSSASYAARVWQACVRVAGEGIGAVANIMRSMASTAYEVGGRLVVGAMDSVSAASSAVGVFCRAVLTELGEFAAGVTLGQIAAVVLVVLAVLAFGYWIMNSEKNLQDAGKAQDARNKAEQSFNNTIPYTMPRFQPGRLG